MDDMTAFEQQLAAGFRDLMGPSEPVDDAAIFASASAAASSRRSFGAVFGATRLALAGAVVALVAGFLMVGLLTQPSDDQGLGIGASPTATASPAASPAAKPSPAVEGSAQRLDDGPFLPAVLPEGTDWGESGSGIPEGQSRWVRISGGPERLPFMEHALPGPDGPLLFDIGGGAHPCRSIPDRIRVPGDDRDRGYCPNGPDLWGSTNALDWEPLELPVKAHVASLTLLDGTYWLATKRPTELWRSTDVETWEQIDLSALQQVGSLGLDWELELGLPITSGGRTVVPLKYTALDADRLLGQDEDGFAFPQPTSEAGRYRIKMARQTKTTDEGVVLITEDGAGLVFERPGGAVLATLDEVDLGFVEAWSMNREIVDRGLAVIDGMTARPTSLVAAHFPSGPWNAEPPAVVSTPDGFRALLLDGRDGTLAAWDSADGTSWAPSDAVEFDEPVEYLEHSALLTGPRLFAYAPFPQDVVWHSDDGRSWQDRPISAGTRPWGPAEIVYRNDRNVVELLVDDYPLVIPGLTWDPEARDLAGNRIATLGDTIFIWNGYRDGLVERELWVIERWEPGGD